MECVQACPKPDTLEMVTVGLKKRFWTLPRVGAFIGIFFLLTVYAASITGFWQSGVSDREFRVRLESVDAPANTHPKIEFNKQ